MKVLRKCTTCRFEISDMDDLHLFEFDKEAKYQHRNRCKECQQKKNKLGIQKRKSNKALLVKYKGGKCIHCDLKYNGKNAVIFDFHHRNPNEKDFHPSDIMFNLERAYAELDKCELLCANCHRAYHGGEY